MKKTDHTIRNEHGQPVLMEDFTRTEAIMAFCTTCLGHETHPSKCTDSYCPLYPFRGKIQIRERIKTPKPKIIKAAA